MLLFSFITYVVILVTTTESARILAYFPTPSISHQVVFRPITLELARRGHEVVVITTDPIFKKGQTPANFTEIDVHDISYNFWSEHFVKEVRPHDTYFTIGLIFENMGKVFEKQIQVKEVKDIINTKRGYFDLLIAEEIVRPTLIFSHIFDVPTILINSLGYTVNEVYYVGSPYHPLLYPSVTRQKINNLSLWEKVIEIYKELSFKSLHNSFIQKDEAMLRRNFGDDVPSLHELRKNVDLLLLNQYSFWDSNRPTPPNVINIGGIHTVPRKELPKDLNTYLNSSSRGVIYISFGTNVLPSVLPSEKIQMLAKVFSELPYDVLWKYDKDEFPGKPDNVKIAKWFPQTDLLNHPNVKLFITQGGLQSTNEAIRAGVPMLGMPMLGDQWYNVEMYEKFNIGKWLDFPTMTEEAVRSAILDILADDSHRKNLLKLQAIMSDEPMTPLERSIWWIEHVLRHKGGKHYRSAAANLTFWEYIEGPLLLTVLGVVLLGIFVVVWFLRCVCSLCGFDQKKKVKRS